jgi:hypothetical protein
MLSVNPNLTPQELRTNIINSGTVVTLTTPDTSFWPWQNNSITFTSRRLNAEAAVATVAQFTVRNLSETTAEITGAVGNLTGNVTIPDFINGRAVTGIGADAFVNCAALTCVSVPFKVETIGNNAFAGCTNLTIRAEAASKPSGWSAGWNPLNRPVSFGRCCVCNGLIGVSGDSHAADCASCGRHVERKHGFTCEPLDDTYHAVNCECGETWQEGHSYRHVSTVSFGSKWRHTYQCYVCGHTMIIIDDTPAIIVFKRKNIPA